MPAWVPSFPRDPRGPRPERILKISSWGIVDEVTLTRGAENGSYTPDEAKRLRAQAIAQRLAAETTDPPHESAA